MKKLNFLLLLTALACSKDSSTPQISVDSPAFIPVVNVDTQGVSIDSKEDYVVGTVSISAVDEGPDLSVTEMKIKGRGNSTWWLGGIWGKKPYQIKFDDKTEILNMPQDKKWVLLAEISDISLIRNKLARDLANMSRFDYVPQAKYTELRINDEYAGVYLIGQKVEESSNRVNIGDEGYLVEIDTDADGRIADDDVYFRPNVWSARYQQGVFNIKEPNVEYNSTEFNLIKDHINRFEATLFGQDFKDPDMGYRSFIDLPSFIDWFFVNEIAKNQDAKSYSSIYFNYIPGEKIKMGPLWDFDLSFGNVDYSDAQYRDGFWVKFHPWYERLFQDPAFVEKVKTRFAFFKQNENIILDKIDAYGEQLQWAQQQNNDEWQTIGMAVWPNPVVFDTYQEEVDHLKSWYSDRMEWLEAAFAEL